MDIDKFRDHNMNCILFNIENKRSLRELNDLLCLISVDIILTFREQDDTTEDRFRMEIGSTMKQYSERKQLKKKTSKER